MRVADVARLFDYVYWANGKIVAVVSTLTPEEFVRPVAGSYGSVRNTLVHMLSAEWGWLERCGGLPRGAKLDPDDYPAVDVLVETWNRVEAAMREFLGALSDADLTRTVEFSFGGPPHVMTVEQLLQQAAMHGVHHRGQVAMLLRMLGHTPGNVDIVLYFAEQASHPAG